jgi:hypothetical protein
MLEGEDLPLSLSARWQLKGCEYAPRTARIPYLLPALRSAVRVKPFKNVTLGSIVETLKM